MSDYNFGSYVLRNFSRAPFLHTASTLRWPLRSNEWPLRRSPPILSFGATLRYSYYFRSMFSSKIATKELNKRIAAFRERAERGIDKKECIGAVSEIFGDVYSFPTELTRYGAGGTFYRARAIPDDDHIIPLRTMMQIGDAWEPPSRVVTTPGRLNAENQSILYCAEEPQVAIDEARARGNRRTAIIVYRSVRPLLIASIGDYENSGLPKDPRTKLFFSFLNHEFSKVISPGREARYTITRTIAETFFNYPEQDAWRYRSVQSNKKFNVAFLPGKQRTCLTLTGVMICRTTPGPKRSLLVDCVVSFDEISGEARYHALGSEMQRKIFPSIRN